MKIPGREKALVTPIPESPRTPRPSTIKKEARHALARVGKSQLVPQYTLFGAARGNKRGARSLSPRFKPKIATTAEVKYLQAKLKQHEEDINAGVATVNPKIKDFGSAKPGRNPTSLVPKTGFTQAEGLKRAYATKEGYFRYGTTLYVCGTRADVSDIADDIKLALPEYLGGGVRQTNKYHQIREYLKFHPDIKMVVGHSLGAAVCDALVQDNPALKEMAYGDPYPQWVTGKGHHRVDGDPISLADVTADTTFPSSIDPHSYWDVASKYGNNDYDDQL